MAEQQVAPPAAPVEAPPTLAVLIYEAATGEFTPTEDLILMRSVPAEALGDGVDPAHDHLTTWAFYYGAAYAAARLMNPLRGEEWLKEQARAAASKVLRWDTTVGGRPGGES